MVETNKVYDLEKRTKKFSLDIISFALSLKHSTENLVLIKQLVRSATSVGANYLEANEKLSDQDFLYRVKVAKKEAKESIYWLELLLVEERQTTDRESLRQEATELMKILATMIKNYRSNTGPVSPT
jgi:four helix bundle protein